MKKRLIAVMLLAITCLTILPLPAFANSHYKTAVGNMDVIFTGTLNSLTSDQKTTICELFNNLPEDTKQWDKEAVNSAIEETLDNNHIVLSSSQKNLLANSIITNAALFSGGGSIEEPPPVGGSTTGRDNKDAGGSTTNDEENEQETGTETDKGGTFERIVAGIVEVPCTVIEGLLQKGGFKTLDELVFMQKNGQRLTEEEKKNLPWEGQETENVWLWFQALLVVTAPFYLVAVIVTAFKFFYAANNPSARAEAMDSIQRWFLSIGIIALAPILVSTIMLLSGLAVDAITIAFQSVASGTVSVWGTFGPDGFKTIVTGSVLGTAIVRLFLMLCLLT